MTRQYDDPLIGVFSGSFVECDYARHSDGVEYSMREVLC